MTDDAVRQECVAKFLELGRLIAAITIIYEIETDPLRKEALATSIASLALAQDGLRPFCPQPKPGNAGAKYAEALAAQRDRRSFRETLRDGVVPGGLES